MGYLIAQTQHGPGMHGPVVLVVLAIAVVGGLVFLVRGLRRSDGDYANDRPSQPSDQTLRDPDPPSDGGSEAGDESREP